MNRILGAVLVAIGLTVAWPAAGASADTCCGRSAVTMDPSQAEPGDTVTLEGLACLATDGGASSPLSLLGGFHLTTASPEVVLEHGAPDASEWPAFATVDDPTALVGRATIVVPELPDGDYHLWWACHDPEDPDGTSYALQNSTGAQLVVGSPPDTAIEGPSEPPSPGTPWKVILAAVGIVGGILGMRRTAVRTSGVADRAGE